MKLSGVLTEAIDAINEAKVPEDLRVTAFKEILGYRLRISDPQGESAGLDDKSGELGAFSSDKRIDRLAKALSLPVDVIERVYGFDGDRLDVIVNPRHLTQTSAGATKELAVLFCAAHQAAGLGEWVHIDLIRGLVEEFGRYDGSNFSKSISALKGDLWVRSSGSQRELKATRDGVERAKELVARIADTKD
jgi:hypothetical protein